MKYAAGLIVVLVRPPFTFREPRSARRDGTLGAASGISAAAWKEGKCGLLTCGREVDIHAHLRRFAMHLIEHGVGGVRRVRAILIPTRNGSDHAHRR
jgi:hypothetical protein